ncbi:MAG: DUF5777 family beta-barrel protein [Saprospiraceae bacterium]
MKKYYCLILILFLLEIKTNAQETNPVDSIQDVQDAIKPKFAKNTFLSSSIINMNSTEIVPKSNLQFQVAHHFGIAWNKDAKTGQNLAQLLGLNSGVAKTYLSLDYSLSNRTNVGIAFAGNLAFEGWIKLKLLRQQTGSKNIPVSVSWISLANANALEDATNDENPEYVAWNKFSFLHQLLIARKISPKISIQVMPAIVHYNIIPYGINNSNNIFSIGIGGKYQVTQNMALTLEYSRQLNMYEDVLDNSGSISNYTPDLLAIGMEVNTGGHEFQFFIGNTTSASNIEQLSRNTNFIKDGKFAMGFRLNRSFFLGKD